MRKTVNGLRFARARSVRTGETAAGENLRSTCRGQEGMSPLLSPPSHPLPLPLAHSTHHPGSLSGLCTPVSSAWNALPLFIPPGGSLPHLHRSHSHLVSAEKPLSQRGTWPPTESALPHCLPGCILLLCMDCYPTFIFSPSR